MKIALVTGSAGQIGSEAVTAFCGRGFTVAGIDNDLRGSVLGEAASTDWNRLRLQELHGDRYQHHAIDIRDAKAVEGVFQRYRGAIALVIHAAAISSGAGESLDPCIDFSVNAQGTLVLLEATRKFCPEAAFVFCSTNKVYGDSPNQLPLVELDKRWEIGERHPYTSGIDESMSVDQCERSLFGASKLAADVLAQEYGRSYGLKTVAFRSGSFSGPSHGAAEPHSFLSRLMQCAVTGAPYTVHGYEGKQVSDHIHSRDLIEAFDQYLQAPRSGEVYNIGGGRLSNCSVLEAISLCEEIADRKLSWSYAEKPQSGASIWWISSARKFKEHFPQWELTRSVRDILEEIYTLNVASWGG